MAAASAVSAGASGAPPTLPKKGRTPPERLIQPALRPGPPARNNAPKKGAAGTVAAAKPGAPRPVIDAGTGIHDFGELWVGPVLKHAFTIKNTGNATLIIRKVKPSCGCTLAGQHPNKLEPGESGEFPFSVASTKLRGKFEKTVTITTNDPATPSLRLRLRGHVKRYVDLTPASVHFGKLYGSEPMERVVKITNNTDKPLELRVTKPPTGNFDVKLEPRTPGQTYELVVTAKPPFKAGVFRQMIELGTNVENQKALRVDMRGMVPKRLDITPTVINIGRLGAAAAAPKRQTTRVVRFANYGATQARLLEATVDDEQVQVTTKTQTEGKSYTIQVQFPAGYEVPPGGRTLTLKTDDPEHPTIAIPIRGLPAVTRRNAAPRKRPAELMVGRRAPTFAIQTTEGKTVSNAPSSTVTVLDFFAPNCGFCKKQIPRLEKIRSRYEGKPVRFVAVSQTMRNKRFPDDQIVDIIHKLNFRGELAIDSDNTVGPLFKATSYPTMVVLGKSGKIEAVNVGNVGDLETRLPKQLDALIAGKAVPTIAAAQPKPAAPTTPVRKRAADLVGKPAPKFTITTFEGKKASDSDFTNHPATVLNFVATNCGYCKKQVPRLEKIRQQYESRGVRFINVVETMRTPFTKDQIVKTFGRIGSKLELAHDVKNDIGSKYGAGSFPTMVVVGKSGKIEAVNVGNVADLETRLPKQLDALMAGKPVPTIAKAAPKKPTTPTRKRAADLIGQPAPKFATSTFEGKSLSNAEFAKHPATVLNFVAGNCGYCKKQVPRVEKIRQKYEARGVRFVNVAMTMRTPFTKDQLLDTFGKIGSKLEMAHDVKNEIGTKFGAGSFPTMVVVGKSGKIEAVNVGNIADIETRLPKQLDALIAGKAVPTIARAAPKQKPPTPARKRAADMIGQPAPKFATTTFEGKPLSDADFAKHPATVLNFVAGNCGYCKKQVPRVEKIRQKYGAKGVRFVNVAMTMRTPFTKEQLTDTFGKLGSKLEMAHDVKNEIGTKYGASGFPTMVVVGKSGKIEAVNVGNVADLETRLPGQLDALIAGRPLPKVAKAPPRPTPKRADALIGKPAPAFSLTTFDGKTVSNAEFAKHPATVLNFVATNCGYCGKQIPRLEKLRQTYDAKGVRFVNVVETMRQAYSKDQVLAKMTSLGSKLEVAHDPPNKVGTLFSARGFPTMVIVGRDGKVAATNIGNLADLEKRVNGQLTALIDGKPLPKFASARPSSRRPAQDMVGKPTPSFSVTTLDGKKLANADFAKYPATVMNFVAPNCGYCKRALPNVEKVRKEYESKGVRFINVVQKMRQDFTNDQIVDVFKKVGSNLEISTTDFGSNSIGRLFKATSYPTMFVVDRSGKIANVNIGAKANLESMLKGQLDALLK